MFAEKGYASSTIREIALAAGVNQSLVFRYFGSKEQLYASSVPQAGYIDAMFEDGPAASIRNLVLSMLPDKDGDVAPVATLIRGAREHDQLGRLHHQGIDQIAAQLGRPIKRPDSALVAELLFAWVVGIGVAHDILRRDEIVSAEPEHIAAVVGEAAAALGVPPEQPAARARRSKAAPRRR